MARHSPEIRLRPVTGADLDMFRRFAVEPGLIGLDWAGFRDPKAVQRRFDTDSYLGEDDGRLIVDVAAGTEPGGEPAGLWRGQGMGWRAQAMFCSYLFGHTPVQRIEAATHAENAAEQRSLEKAGFTL
ncbi:MAG: GNAT family N-acetyltransferase, partial [Trebonia sp.]